MWLEIGVGTLGLAFGFSAGVNITPGGGPKIVGILGGVLGTIGGWSVINDEGSTTIGKSIFGLSIGFIAGIILGNYARQVGIPLIWKNRSEPENERQDPPEVLRDRLTNPIEKLERVIADFNNIIEDRTQEVQMRDQLGGVLEILEDLQSPIEEFNKSLDSSQIIPLIGEDNRLYISMVSTDPETDQGSVQPAIALPSDSVIGVIPTETAEDILAVHKETRSQNHSLDEYEHELEDEN